MKKAILFLFVEKKAISAQRGKWLELFDSPKKTFGKVYWVHRKSV